MKILAVSDLHGNLIKINDSSDVFVIAGDWSPLYIQRNYKEMLVWLDTKFIPWLSNINSKYVVFIAGNHDFVCETYSFNERIESMLKTHGCADRIFYLNRSSVLIEGKKFYGIPETEMPNFYWAFTKLSNTDYSFDDDTNILITHQPPKFGNLGFVDKYNRDFGSYELYETIKNSNLDLCLCGHIHEGSHEEHILENNNHKIHLFNVSILNEDYNIFYEPTYIEL